MAYRVKITARTERDLVELYEHIRLEESELARDWYLGLREAILSLRNMPGRCSRTRENRDLKHLLYGRKPHGYRVVFRVVEKKAGSTDIAHSPRSAEGWQNLKRSE